MGHLDISTVQLLSAIRLGKSGEDRYLHYDNLVLIFISRCLISVNTSLSQQHRKRPNQVRLSLLYCSLFCSAMRYYQCALSRNP